MCRLAAFPPNYPRDQALEILLAFEKSNVDGVGSVHIKNGKFVVDKHATSLSKLLSKGHNFLGHMEKGWNGWTLAHLRLASHGGVALKNTHPFLIGDDWAFVHNGVWSNYKFVRLALSKSVKFEGETDTEVAGHLWNVIGPKKFAEELDYGGVFMGLNRNGQLQVAKVSGDLEVFHRKNRTILLASELPRQYKRKFESGKGWYHYDKNGFYLNHKVKTGGTTYTGGSYTGTYFGHGHTGSQPYRYNTSPNNGSGASSGSGVQIGGCNTGGGCGPLPPNRQLASPVFGESDFARIGDSEEWQRQVNEELAEQLGLSPEDAAGVPSYVPREGGALGITHQSLDDEENWKGRD